MSQQEILLSYLPSKSEPKHSRVRCRALYPSTQKAEVGAAGVQGQPELHSKILFQTKDSMANQTDKEAKSIIKGHLGRCPEFVGI